MAFVADITERKQVAAERDIMAARTAGALAEKTVLLKEVHHRVKSNLAIIAGVLEMQADFIEDRRAQEALANCQRRVLSMAMIHEHLYATELLDRVNFGQYVEQLVQELCGSYAVQPDLVKVDIRAEEIELPVNRAIPCGLIVNELLCNSLKYAFPDGRNGSIEIDFRRLESGGLLLACADDGVGMPHGLEWQNGRSLGLRIVHILAKQLNGALTLERNRGGTRFELRLMN